MARLTGKVAIVTGSSSGIGKAIALRYGAEGAKVVVTARRLALCEQTVAQIVAQGGEARAIQTDVADEQQVERLIAETVTRYGRLDVLVNNAAIVARGPIGAVTDDDLERVVTTNFTAQVRLIRAALPHLTDCLINIGSGALYRPVPNSGVYIATKAADRKSTRLNSSH